MELLNEYHTFTGMQKDANVSKQQSSFLYDARNIRLTAREGETLLAITNEKGTTPYIDITVRGTYLGHCLINKYLVVFSTGNTGSTPSLYDDCITRIDLSMPTGGYVFKELYRGALGFSLDYPIEAISSYESEAIQKVYWTDGLNQPRVINITKDILDGADPVYNDSSFDFIRKLQLNESVTVQKQLGSSGLFAPGVIQYAFTYYTKHGQESNIFYTTPLLYISHKDRGSAPDARVENAFKITITDLDTNFDFLRIYSIQRTSLNGTPIVKRIQDISITEDNEGSITFIDTGMIGDNIDPTELLYKGGEEITAETLEQKDNTLFLGNIKITRKLITEDQETSIRNNITITEDTRNFYPLSISKDGYIYCNQLTSFDTSTRDNNSVPCGGFKYGDYYRLGVQFQDEYGKWSNPIFLQDKRIASNRPSSSSEYGGRINVPIFVGVIGATTATNMYNAGYRKARAVVVFPEAQDRVVLCQGVVCPTVYTNKKRTSSKSLYAQSSWFFRPKLVTGTAETNSSGVTSPVLRNSTVIEYTSKEMTGANIYLPQDNIRKVEIQGEYDPNDKFNVDLEFCTLHSPDIEFDDSFTLMNYTGLSYRSAGKVYFTNTMSDITIQTESPTVSNNANGFMEEKFDSTLSHGIVAGLFYEDYVVEDKGTTGFRPYSSQRSPVKWIVYPWNRTGSLNNDINRPSDQGTRTSLLKKKIISNLRYAETILSTGSVYSFNADPVIFSDDQLSIVKIHSAGNVTVSAEDKVYQGNVDTLLNPYKEEGTYFAFNNNSLSTIDQVTPFTNDKWWKTFAFDGDNNHYNAGLYRLDQNGTSWVWSKPYGDVGEEQSGLAVSKEPVRMKYKSSAHLVVDFKNSTSTQNIPMHSVTATSDYKSVLPVVEIMRHTNNDDYRDTMFGGTTMDAKKANTWVPCGEPVIIRSGESLTYKYEYGDTYYQRWDCLKTFAFSDDDINQIVEIGSFELESHINIDGRYDRNRGQLDNTRMNETNFNLINMVYTQRDNFFSYKILDSEYYSNVNYPNQITWSKEKQVSADTDLWTNITLASVYNMDGSKGEVVSLNLWKDQILCFQNKGVSTILFNSRVQIPTSDGVPIEITNSYKVDGYRYLSDGVGCNNKLLIKETPSGVYFIDSVGSNLYHISDGMQDVSTTHNMSSWFKDNTIRRLLYDDVNKDVYIVKEDESLCFSEILGQFVSFYDYDNILLTESYLGNVFTMRGNLIYVMFQGDYNNFFGTYKPWEFTFISNGIDNSAMTFDKIFTTLDYRMDMSNSQAIQHDESLNYIRVTDEYQDTGKVSLSRLLSISKPRSYHHTGTNLQKKFRNWRIQIPRNQNSRDRIRNTWCKVTLGNDALDNHSAILYDLAMQYYV